MLSVKKTTHPDGKICIELAGVIDASDLNAILGEVKGPVDINCSGVTRINSAGVRSWLFYFTSLLVSKFPVKLKEVSFVLVEQLNLIQNFAGFAEVISVMTPYVCSKCKHEFQVVMKKEEIPQQSALIAKQFCPKCGGLGNFDDDPDFYLKFSRK